METSEWVETAGDPGAACGVEPDTTLDSELDADLGTALDTVAGWLNASHGRLVDIAIALLADPSRWQGPDMWSLPQYLAWRTGISPARARQIELLAGRAHELPVCTQALRDGEISIDQAVAVARRTPWWADREACELARSATVSQLQRSLGRYPFPDLPHPDAPPDAADGTDEHTGDPDDAEDHDDRDDGGHHDGDADDTSPTTPAPDDPAPKGSPTTEAADWCSFHTGDDGRFRLHLECDALTGMTVTAALGEARDRLVGERGVGVGWVDAMHDVAERSLDAVDSTARRDRHRLHVHLDTDATATDAAGWRLPDAIRDHLTCDGWFTPTFLADQRPIGVGRTQRLVPERTRRVVIRRDGGCRVPGCHGCSRIVEIHHIIHWTADGPTETWNLVALCPRHHRLHHQGKLGISGNADEPDGLAFTNARGDPITPSGARPRAPERPPPTPSGRWRHPTGERLESTCLYFNPPPEHRPRPTSSPALTTRRDPPPGS